MSHEGSSETFPATFPFDVTLSPEGFLGNGWLRASRESPGAPLSAGTSTGAEGSRREYWAGSTADLTIPLEATSRGDLHFTLNLRAPWQPGLESQPVTVTVGAAHRTFSVGYEQAETKLFVIPRETLEGDVLSLQLHSAWELDESVEFRERPPVAIALECSAITVYRDRTSFLSALQEEYDRFVTSRDELFDRGLAELADRGELVDKVRLTLSHLERLEDRGSFATSKLHAFLDDPYVQGSCGARLIFDERYFETHAEELHQGRIQAALRAWHRDLEAFHLAVVWLGNRAFLELGDHKPGVRSGVDPLRALIETIDLPKRKLRRLKERNDHLNTLELLLGRDQLESVVPDLEIEMSSYCNYACVMCGRSWNAFQFTRQTDEQLRRLLPVMPYIRHVTIAGVGENTTSDRLDVFARMCEVFGVETRIFTNGSMIHLQLEALARFTKVCVSFDGGSAETFELQRRGANFERVLRNVRLLRERAPEITLTFSVVISRLNYHEMPRIAEIAGELGVDHVAFSPVWEVSPLQLRSSDRERFDRLLEEARAIAARHAVVIQVNVTPEDFDVQADEPLDRGKLEGVFRELDFPNQRIPGFDVLEQKFEGLTFQYHPDPSVFPDRSWPEPPPPAEHGANSSRSRPFSFDIKQALARTEDAIRRARRELKKRPRSEIEIPYCLSIWKYTYTRANGKNRLCPSTFTDVGDIARDGFQGVTNGEKNRHFRRSMFGGEKAPYCVSCLDPYRRWGHAKVIKQVRKLRLDPRDRTRYSVNH